MKKSKKIANVDWKTIKIGSEIKILKKSGTYYTNSSGEKQYMIDPGIYLVTGREENGLRVYKNGFSFVYMGEEKQSSLIPNMYDCPHKIIIVNQPPD